MAWFIEGVFFETKQLKVLLGLKVRRMFVCLFLAVLVLMCCMWWP